MMERRSLCGSTRECSYISGIMFGLNHPVSEQDYTLSHRWVRGGNSSQTSGMMSAVLKVTLGVCIMGCVQDSWWCVSSQLQSAEWKERLVKRIKTRGSLRTRVKLKLPYTSTAVHKKISTWIAYVSSGCTVFFLFLVPLICLGWVSVKARTFSFSFSCLVICRGWSH